jgi:hypothetical protein
MYNSSQPYSMGLYNYPFQRDEVYNYPPQHELNLHASYIAYGNIPVYYDSWQNFAVRQPNFPLRGSHRTELGDHRRMGTIITISANGRLDGRTRTWTSKKWKGFTGTVVVFLTDARGNILYATAPRRYGVNGTALGGHNRTDTWFENIPRDVLNNTSGYAIHHAHTPTPRINATEFKKWAEAVAPLIKAYSSGQTGRYLLPEAHEVDEDELIIFNLNNE